ncbi:MAG: hypothetical protein LBG49_03220 [Mycoplasmataceae bacterium]|nr:hypothetical protein [Mycoplasmataceae bacterium]
MEEIKHHNHQQIILLVESPLCDVDSYINQYFSSFDEDPKFKDKILSKKYLDLVFVDGESKIIDKETITSLIDSSYYSATEKWGYKFFVIKNIENSNKQSLNALLKFLEEPPRNTFGIITAKSLQKVLPTIVSRCRVHKMQTNPEQLKNLAKQYQLNNEQISILKNVYFDLKSAINDLTNGQFIENYNFVMSLINNNNNIQTIKKLSDIFFVASYKKIRQIIESLFVLTNKAQLLPLLDTLHVNPIKPLLFNSILRIIK